MTKRAYNYAYTNIHSYAGIIRIRFTGSDSPSVSAEVHQRPYLSHIIVCVVKFVKIYSIIPPPRTRSPS